MGKHITTVIHTFEPVYDARSRVLLLGTMPSPKSRENGFYYGHPQNRFWRVLTCLFNEDVPASIPEKQAFLLRHRLALWDVLQSCDIKGADDATIKKAVVNDFHILFAEADIAAVFTLGQKAAALFKKHCEPVYRKKPITLPSTSPANCRLAFDELVSAYSLILEYVSCIVN